MKISGFSVRNGCCRYYCCCEDSDKILDYGCCCVLYSFSLQGSNDNITWKTLYKVEKEKEFWACMYKTYELEKETESYALIRLVQDDPYPDCPYCMQLNQVELYGSTIVSEYYFSDLDDNDESVSIIGKIKRDQSE